MAAQTQENKAPSRYLAIFGDEWNTFSFHAMIGLAPVRHSNLTSVLPRLSKPVQSKTTLQLPSLDDLQLAFSLSNLDLDRQPSSLDLRTAQIWTNKHHAASGQALGKASSEIRRGC